MKSVLVVAQYFPPAGGVGTFRVAKFVKYLPDFGWQPLVLSVDPRCYERDGWPLDATLVSDISSGVRLIRTPLTPKRLLKDAGLRWLPQATKSLAALVRRERPDVVYLTGDPFFPLTAAPLVMTFTRLKFRYVVDFRDPWSLAARDGRRSIKLGLVRLLSEVAERFVLSQASRLICVSAAMLRQYREKYGHKKESFFQLITNGYDPADYQRVPARVFDRFTIVYTGKFKACERFRDPASFFTALKQVSQQTPSIRFLHIGEIEPRVVEAARSAGLSHDQAEFVGFSPYAEAIAAAKGADLLLLIGTGEMTEQTGKVFDYIACERPILALVHPETDVGLILQQCPCAMIVDDVPSSISRAIRAVMKRPRDQRPIPDQGRLGRFERKALASQLAEVLDSVSQNEAVA